MTSYRIRFHLFLQSEELLGSARTAIIQNRRWGILVVQPGTMSTSTPFAALSSEKCDSFCPPITQLELVSCKTQHNHNVQNISYAPMSTQYRPITQFTVYCATLLGPAETVAVSQFVGLMIVNVGDQMLLVGSPPPPPSVCRVGITTLAKLAVPPELLVIKSWIPDQLGPTIVYVIIRQKIASR